MNLKQELQQLNVKLDKTRRKLVAAEKRFDEATIAELLEIAWWDWPKGKIERAIPTILAGDIAALKAT